MGHVLGSPSPPSIPFIIDNYELTCFNPKIDVLVNNAGVAQIFSVEDGDFEVEKNILEINLLGPISLTKAVLPHMLKRQQGQIVVVSSIQAKYCKNQIILI